MKTIRTAGTLIEHDGKILILLRRGDIAQPGTWGLPAGKVHAGESDIDCAVREIRSETGLTVTEKELEKIHEFDWHFPEVRVQFPTYRLRLASTFTVQLNEKEHAAYQWITPHECYRLDNLIHGFKDLLETIYHCNN